MNTEDVLKNLYIYIYVNTEDVLKNLKKTINKANVNG